MNLLTMIFEEDIAMQDAVDDIEDFADDSSDIILGTIEDRYNEKRDSETHLFEKEPEVNEDGLTDEEETELNVALLNTDDVDLEDLVDDEDIDLE